MLCTLLCFAAGQMPGAFANGLSDEPTLNLFDALYFTVSYLKRSHASVCTRRSETSEVAGCRGWLWGWQESVCIPSRPRSHPYSAPSSLPLSSKHSHYEAATVPNFVAGTPDLQVVTSATVGFGDICPSNDSGRAFTLFAASYEITP